MYNKAKHDSPETAFKAIKPQIFLMLQISTSVTVGLFIVVLAYLEYQRIIHVDWTLLQTASQWNYMARKCCDAYLKYGGGLRMTEVFRCKKCEEIHYSKKQSCMRNDKSEMNFLHLLKHKDSKYLLL